MLQLEALRKKGDAITLYDISAVLDDMARHLGNNTSKPNASVLQEEIVKIANHIDITKRELSSLMPGESAHKNISQLEAVIKATEEAAFTILDSTDEVIKLIKASDASPETKDRILAMTTRIYEACNFQDLTGQRIIKVIRELEFVEAKIRSLINLFSSSAPVAMQELSKTKKQRPDQHLLNGPQLGEDAPLQADIDALFNKT
jgi:chemotaxis protein CheZ